MANGVVSWASALRENQRAGKAMKGTDSEKE